ncbi:large ribosomal subunit protein uL11-like [Loxodonta africana]|uniref:large ribosomal subunit protein uL11-like n=1 Tax=Loxodonta africana TaxID=9785 RepID=UPI000C813693|nr:60S ribosomal protein L12-like [Loxodonta africana]
MQLSLVVQHLGSSNTPAPTMSHKFDANENKVMDLRYIRGEVGATSSLAPKINNEKLFLKKGTYDIAKAPSDWKGLRVMVKLTIQNKQPQIEMVPSAPALAIKTLKESPRDRGKLKNIKQRRNSTFDEIVNVAQYTSHPYLARELSGTIKEILRIAHSVS